MQNLTVFRLAVLNATKPSSRDQCYLPSLSTTKTEYEMNLGCAILKSTRGDVGNTQKMLQNMRIL